MKIVICLFIVHCAEFISSSAVQLEEQFHALQDTCKQLKDHTRQLQFSLQELKDDNLKLCTKLQNMKQYVIDVDSYYRVENLEILGVPKTEGEDLVGIISNISVALGIPFNISDISTIWRRQEVSGRNYYKSSKLDTIIIRFVSRTLRNKWLSGARKLVFIDSKKCVPNLPQSQIYVNEHLSNTKKALAKKAKHLEEENKILYAWLKDGNLYIRLTPEGKAIKIKTHSDLKALGLIS